MSIFERFSQRIAQWTGSTPAFLIAASVVIVWAATGPIFHYSETWQLVINTGTTIVTFLMVFLIQRQQNKDALAIHTKLNELIAATRTANNRLVNAEELTEEELQVLHRYYQHLAKEAKEDAALHQTHSVEAASSNQESKHRHHQRRNQHRKGPTPLP